MSDTGAIAAALRRAARRELADPAAEITGLERLTGGASREMWRFDIVRADGVVDGAILRRDPTGSPLASGGATEAALLGVAGDAGVPVPRVRFHLAESDGIGAGFVMERLVGETIPRKLLRDDAYAVVRNHLTAQCGEILARLHAVDLAAVPAGLAGATSTATATAEAELGRYRMLLDSFGDPHPALEYGLRWLGRHLPPPRPPALVHGDFRNGNLMVDPERGVVGVLDWELAHVGNPIEDLGWLCVRSWRFGADDHPAGGFGSRAQLCEAYTLAGGAAIDLDELRWWEAFGTLKWGGICILQVHRHLSGTNPSLELAAIGRRVAECEYDLLRLIDEAA